ncbi:enolase C-terminal domain-like protein [Pedobacter lusitanus]|uniref:enolase C-terminal domain-like protein n=1 Tax=Pedobacter lusitanus TaxID=1503925 RepID=UPI000AEB26DE|nr:enolase C-terminal domain-like protein [Pedobacter lusitanus]
MQAVHISYNLELKHPFSITGFTRTSTPLLLLKLTYENTDGYGEASMVPYLGENYNSAEAFLDQVDWARFTFPFNFEEIVTYLDSISAGNPAIKAAIDIALNDINGKIRQKPCFEIYQADAAKMPVTSYTIGMDKPEIIKEKVAGAKDFKVLKIKLGSANDKELINTIRSVSDLPLYVDANQGWTERKMAIDLIYWLHDQGVLLIEQPMDKKKHRG